MSWTLDETMAHESAFQTHGAHGHDNHEGPQSHQPSSAADIPLCIRKRGRMLTCVFLHVEHAFFYTLHSKHNLGKTFVLKLTLSSPAGH